jgi:hypothetical protein
LGANGGGHYAGVETLLFWNEQEYTSYRKFVQAQAPKLKGETDDCADLSLRLIVEFAASKGLPLTFTSTVGVRFVSKAARVRLLSFKHETWSSEGEYLKSVQAHTGDKALWNWNTVRNEKGPEPGDLLLKPDHAALIFATYPPGQPHPKAADRTVPDYPGGKMAASQLDTLEYFRDIPGRAPGAFSAGIAHFDYLNHRGEGHPPKQKAELIYYAAGDDTELAGFEFRKFNWFVFWNWPGWDGSGDPPRWLRSA